MKKNTKKTKPAFVVDLTNAETAEDVKIAFIEAKVKAGVPINMQELLSYAIMGIEIAAEMEREKVHVINDDKLAQKMVKLIKKSLKKKTPWYKRIFKWPFGKKN